MNKRMFRLLIVFIIFALYPVAVHIVLILQDKICWSGTDSYRMKIKLATEISMYYVTLTKE